MGQLALEKITECGRHYKIYRRATILGMVNQHLGQLAVVSDAKNISLVLALIAFLGIQIFCLH